MAVTNNTDNFPDHIEVDQTDKNKNKFILPNLNLHSTAATAESVRAMTVLHRLPERNPEYPSLEPSALGYFNMWQGTSNVRGAATGHIGASDHGPLSSRITAVMNDIAIVHREDPFAKLVIFSQWAESLLCAMNMFKGANNLNNRNALARGMYFISYFLFFCII